MPNKPDMSAWEKANQKLAEARKKREAERGTSRTTNPLMADFKTRMEKREMEKAKEDLKAEKKAARKGGRKYGGKAMGAKDTARNFSGDGEGQVYTPATKIPSKDYSKKPTTNSADQYKAKKEAPKTSRRSPAAGREDMMSRQRRQEIMDREERKRKNDKDKGGSNVIG
jgi:hypothetical protein